MKTIRYPSSSCLQRNGIFLLPLLVGVMGHVQAASSWDGKTPVEYVVSVETDKPDAIYHKGDTVTFNIQLLHNQQPATEGTVDWVITKDSVVPPIAKGTATLTDGKATVTGKLDEPGFLRCDVTFKQDKTTFTAPAAAAIDPTEIKPSMPTPDDFDAFWAEKKKELAAVPINAVITPVPPPPDRPGVETFAVQADCVGKPISGYYARPAGAKPKSCPALLMVEGAGVLSTDLLSPTRWGQKGFLALDINAHGIPNGQPKEFYAALNNGELKDYRIHGRESRDTYYFLGMYLRVIRALDFLATQPEWDGHTLFIEGGSQGGAQAIAGAGLDPRVSFIFAAYPAGCDHTGMVAGRIAGWPKVVPMGADGKPDPAVLQASRYFDGVNFASRIKAPAFFWIGFLDKVAPPTCSYAAYNNIPGKKQIINDPSHGHDKGDDPKFWTRIAEITIAEQKAQATPAASP